ncbi:hypothetical protein OQA88_13208 [Cercophora sp. LCS_1]
MTTLPSTDSGGPADPTYRQYTPDQAATYAKHRPSPPPALVNLILGHHAATGGRRGVLLDVGCGPGMATRALSPHFGSAIGCDAGESMIQVARELGGETATGQPIRWEVCDAETIDQIPSLVPTESIDLVTAAYAAHWFDMPKFWAAAAKILKPGGTVALWTSFREEVGVSPAFYQCDLPVPATPEEAKVRAIFTRFHAQVLDAYSVAGTQVTRDGYRNLPMPWDSPATARFFERDTFFRRELDRRDLAGAGSSTEDVAKTVAADPLAASIWQRVENLLDTMDAVTRWREAHPDLAGTDRDCVKLLISETMQAVADGKAKIDFRNIFLGKKTVLLCVKRAAG